VHPGVLVTSVLWAVSGACTAYQVQLVTESMQVLRWRYRVVRLTPNTSATSVKGVPAVTMRVAWMLFAAVITVGRLVIPTGCRRLRSAA